VWAERGSRPTAPKQGAFGNLHVLTAVCPATGRAEGLVAPVLDTGVVQSFLDQLSATIPAGTHVVLVWDGAGYHSASRSLRPPANLTLVTLPPYSPELNPVVVQPQHGPFDVLVTLPPYSPELNPVERLWLYLRQHHWSNRTYADVAALEQAAVAGWRAACLTPEKVRSVCRCEYAGNGS